MERLEEVGIHMNENETELEAMLADADAWETPARSPRKKSEQRQRGAMVSVRLSPDELAKVQHAAEREGMSVSSYMRSRALMGDGVRGSYQPVTTRNATFSDADMIWRGDVHTEVSPYLRRPAYR